jgi:DNA mismatch repair protein MutL
MWFRLYRDPNLDTPYSYQNKEAERPVVQFDQAYNPFAEDTRGIAEQSGAKPTKSFSGTSYKRAEVQSNWESLYVGLKQDTHEIDTATFENDEVTASLFNEKEDEQVVKQTYQIQKKYIVSPIKSGMVIIDQQRAHQRILYEQFLTSMTVRQASSQQLLFPLQLHFSNNEIVLIKELQESLENTGFIFDKISEDNITVLGIPVSISESQVVKIIESLLHDLVDGIPNSSFSQNDTIAKSMARSLAIKTGTYLTETEQVNIVHNLFACKETTVSPFQKPTFITISAEDLDKKFTL